MNECTQVLEEVGCQSTSTKSSIDADDDTVSTGRPDDRPPTLSSLASYQRTSRTNESPSIVSSQRPNTESPSTLSSHSRCSCSRRVTDIRAFAGFYSDGDVDDAAAMETRRSLRSTASEGGAFRRVLPAFHQRSHSNDSAPTPRDYDVTDDSALETRSGNGRNPSGLMTEKHQRGSDRLSGGVLDPAQAAGNHIKEPGKVRKFEAGDWSKVGGLGVADRQRKRTATSEWVNGLVCEALPGHRRRRGGRHVMSVAKSGAGLRAISETGDTCRLAAVSSSLATDVSHPVIRGLYRPAAPAVLASTAASRPSSSSSSSSASVTATGRQGDNRAESDGHSSDDSQHSV